MKKTIAHEARAEFLQGSNDIGILVIHGFTGSTQSMRLIAYALHEKGYTVNMPCLKGHGTTPEDMENSTYQEWIASVTEAYQVLKSKVSTIFVLGLSMGGTLTLYSAINFAVKGIITINAAIELPHLEVLYQDPSQPQFIPGIGSDIKKVGIKEWAYDRAPKKSIGNILQLMALVKKQLSTITCPILIFKSLEDHVVPPINQDYIFEHVGSHNKQMILLENSYHVATLDNDVDNIIQRTLRFISQNS